MSDLLAGITDGQLNLGTSTTTKSAGNQLGKDAFLQLLVTQMKYQDPLNPNTDTEYIAQLAQFSQLEQMQNLNSNNQNSQAFSLVGKSVVVKTTNAAGNVSYIEGPVDYVKVENGSAKLCINGSFYTMDQLSTVYDDYYMLAQGAPTVEEKNLSFDKDNAKDITLKVDMGSTSVASRLAIVVNGEAIDSKYLSLSSDGTLTIKKEAFENLPNGTHNLVFSFDDALGTVVSNKASVTVSGTTESKTESENQSVTAATT